MAAEWYYEIDGKTLGPVSAAQLKQLAAGGKLQGGHLIWKKGMAKKVPARSVKGLFDESSKGAAGAKKVGPGPASRTSKLAGKSEAAEAAPEDADAVMVEEFVEAEAVEEAEIAEPPPPAVGRTKTASAPGAKAPAGATGGKDFRVRSEGKVSGPYTLAEIRGLLNAGKLGSSSLVGFETWLPIGTFRELVGGGAGRGIGKGTTDAEAAANGTEPVMDLDAVEVVEEAVMAPPKAKAVPTKLDEDLIPVDEEFKIGG